MYAIRDKSAKRSRQEVDEKLREGYKFYLVQGTNLDKRKKALDSILKKEGKDIDYEFWSITYRVGYYSLLLIKQEMTRDLRFTFRKVNIRVKTNSGLNDEGKYTYLQGHEIKQFLS